jgi:hypothetical protein
MHDLGARQMLRQGPARGLRLGCRAGGGSRLLRRRIGPLRHLQFFEPQLQLFDLVGQPLRGAAELHAAQPGDLHRELLDLQGLGHKTGLGGRRFGLGRLQRGGLLSDERAQPRHLLAILSRRLEHSGKTYRRLTVKLLNQRRS